MNKRAFYFSKGCLAFIVTLAALSFTLGGCSSTSTANSSNPSGGQNNLSFMQQYGNLSVRFFGVMTFEATGTQVTSPSELAVSGVPIIWMGTIFNGTLEESGAGEDVKDEVHGSLSSDGNWLESAYYSRQIIRTTVNSSGTFYRITLANVPLTGSTTITPLPSATGTPSGLGTFQLASSDVQKYITKIEYSDGPLNGSQIQSTTKYITTDWKNSRVGQLPSLRVTFAIGSGNAGQTPSKPGMMGGQ